MDFWASSESFAPAGFGLERARKFVEPYLIAALENSSIADVDLTLQYVPIVMPKEMHDHYKERSKAIIKKKIYNCAPHLNYDVFVSDNFCEQIKEYLRGVSLSIPYLARFGLTVEQVSEFTAILAEARKILTERAVDQGMH